MRALLLLLCLAACAEFPALDTRIPEAERNAPPPALQPLGTLLGAADALPAAPVFEGDLRAGAADLAERSAALGTATTADDAERLAALGARAEALRAQGLTDEERARLAP